MPSASSLFLLFSIAENLLLEIFSELDENLRGIFIRQDDVKNQRTAWGAPRGQGQPLAAAPWGPVGGTRPGTLGILSAPHDAYKYLFDLKLLGRRLFSTKSTRSHLET